MRRSRDESVPLPELAQILETDSTLTIELLKYVNSSSTGLRNKAKTVLQAITLLGCARCRLFVIATGMGAAVRSQCSKLIDQTAFWSDTLQKAIFAREIALLLRTDPDVAFVGAPVAGLPVPLPHQFPDRRLSRIPRVAPRRLSSCSANSKRPVSAGTMP